VGGQGRGGGRGGGGGRRGGWGGGVGVVDDAQHAQGASAGVHGGGVCVVGGELIVSQILSLYSRNYPVDEEDEDVVGRLRRCWLRGMPRCTER
jgi:hypothetical protein